MNCPAYIYSTARNNLNYTYQLNDNSRVYQKVTLTLGLDGGGRVTATKARASLDASDPNIDSYNTYNVEVCDGLESKLTATDPPEKCSFGHRLSQYDNCYGKLEMDYGSARAACSRRGGHLLKIDSETEYYNIRNLFPGQSLGIGLHDENGLGLEWDGYPKCKIDPLPMWAYLEPIHYTWEDNGCFYVDTTWNKIIRFSCNTTTNWICEARRPSENPIQVASPVCAGEALPQTTKGGDLLADEGGFCLWYLKDQFLTLPDDESNGFHNTDLADWLAFTKSTSTNKYFMFEQYNRLYKADLDGHPKNAVNWDSLTYGNVFGAQSVSVDPTVSVIPKAYENYDFHCHHSPTNFGISRIYLQQHMLERLYPGAFAKHCFCGIKHMGKLVTRCDCTLDGVRNSNCRKEHRQSLYEWTNRTNGALVYCNDGQCDVSGF